MQVLCLQHEAEVTRFAPQSAMMPTDSDAGHNLSPLSGHRRTGTVPHPLCTLILLIGIAAFCAPPAQAALGGAAADLAAEAARVGSEVRWQSLTQYEVGEIDAGSGVIVREYVDRAGQVFAVSWTGPVPPDMRQLLGIHFAQYAAGLAAFAHPGLKRSVRVATPDLIVEAGGHLRAYSGRAYLPALLPGGVVPGEFR